MVATIQPLLTRKAADLMTRMVVLVPKDMSIPGAAHLLAQAQVSGAPVVDAHGRCIGVISATDFVHYAEKEKVLAEPRCAHAMQSWEIRDAADNAGETVADYMTKDPIMASPDTSIGSLARMMIDVHIHRVVVVDEKQRPIGIVSSTDILAAVAQADARF